MKRLKYLASINPPLPRELVVWPDDVVSFLPMELVGEDGTLDLSETRLARDVSQGYTAMADGDVIVAKITPCFENGKGALCEGLKGGVAFGTTELIVLRPKRAIDARFLSWLTRCNEFRAWGEAEMRGSAGQKRVTEEFVANFRVVDIASTYQKRIADHLDLATAKINRLIALRRRQIILLAEQRTAIIQQALACGLNASLPTKDSGLEWLPRIPATWEIIQVRHLVSLVTSGSRGWAEFYSDQGDIFIQSGNITRVMTLDLSNPQYVQPPLGAEGERTKVRHGDILVCITGALTGNVALVDFDPPTAYVNQHLALLRPRLGQVEPKYLALALWSDCGRTQFKFAEYGGTKQGLGLEDVRHAVVAIPPLAEQRAILAFVDANVARIESLVAAYARQISLLSEYRSALINETVTGQRAILAHPADIAEAA